MYLEKIGQQQIKVFPRGLRKFLVFYVRSQTEIDLDFNPLVLGARLKPGICLLHWHAMPIGYRIWGLWEWPKDGPDNYYVFRPEHFRPGNHPHRLVQINDLLRVRPTACVCYDAQAKDLLTEYVSHALEFED